MRRAQWRVIAERRRVEGILSTIGDQFIMLDRNWRYVYANDRALEATRKTRDQLIGKVIWDLYPGLVGTDFEAVGRTALPFRALPAAPWRIV